MSINRRERVLAVGLVAAASWQAAWADDPAPLSRGEIEQSLDAGAELLGPVVVTAPAPGEDQGEPPLSKSVADSEEVEDAEGDLMRLVGRMPNAIAVSSSLRNSTIAIRGIGAVPATESQDNPNGLYVDGIYYPRPASLSFDMFDLERVELIRGPQDILFGRNTVAGALNVLTARPSFEPGAEISLSIGSDRYFRATGMVTGPVSDTLALRLSVSHAEREGAVENINPGSEAADRLNGTNDYGLRAQMLWEPTDDFSLRIVADRSEQDIDCCVQLPGQNIETQADGSDFPDNSRERQLGVGYTEPTDGARRRQTDVNARVEAQAHQGGVLSEATWYLPDYKLTSLTAWRSQAYAPRTDSDYTALAVLNQFGVSYDQEQFSQDLRLASTGRRVVDHVFGLQAFWQHVDSLQDQEFGADAASILIVPTLPPLLGPLLEPAIRAAIDGLHVYQASSVDTASVAAFGQATWNITDDTALSAGLRYTLERKSGEFRQYLEGGGGNLPDPIASLVRDQIARPDAWRDSRTDGGLSARISLAHQISEGVSAYVSYARGGKPGGINFAALSPGPGREVAAETADTAELGVRTRLLGGRLSVDGTLYWTELRDYQAVKFDRDTLASYLSNVGRVRSRGAEIDAALQISPALGIRASLAYNETEIQSYPDAPCPPDVHVSSGEACVVNLAGHELEGAPRWTAAVGFDYTRPLGSWRGDDLEGFIGGDFNYVSAYKTEASSDYTRVKGRGITNLKVGLRSADRRWSLALWANNLFDVNYDTAQASLPLNLGGTVVVPGDPLMLGVTATLRY
ncbi:TonB-dependent receptor [Zavarzinia sp.]|uniref:TonB-dependent receptor n=1 Tax=Zavarzinia sp. TaxID=2027920 RepID=UPI003BB4FE56